jgi:NAD(P)-dependent dehydrogenase (short-subunit alcohol dehydrogenase family)
MVAGRVAGKVAVVTGSASGIGRVTALTLAREGAAVVLADIDEQGAQRVANEIAADGGRALAQRTDVSVEDDVKAMVDAAVSAFGGIHVLHNNAAITDPRHQVRDTNVVGLDAEVWDRTMMIDLRGVMFGCKHAVRPMIASGGGSIINTSSNASMGGDLGLTAYAAAKGGINTLSLSVATAFGKQGVRCNTVSPAHIASPSLAANVSAEVAAALLQQCLVPRLGTPQDIANMVLFLASDESSFVTGQTLRVDGGALSHLPQVAQVRART